MNTQWSRCLKVYCKLEFSVVGEIARQRWVKYLNSRCRIQHALHWFMPHASDNYK